MRKPKSRSLNRGRRTDLDAEAALAEVQAKADENWERYVRALAEAENVRKRAGEMSRTPTSLRWSASARNCSASRTHSRWGWPLKAPALRACSRAAMQR